MNERHDAENSLARPPRRQQAFALRHVGGNRPMRQLHALGPTGRTAGIEQQRLVIGRGQLGK